MKKLFTLAFSMLGLVASAQQVNGDFNAEWENCFPWEKGANSTKAYGKTPQGWIVSNVPNALVSEVASAIEEEGTDGFAVKLTNQSAAGQKIPAYISLGTTWATAETKMTTVRNADGGDFGGIKFSNKPDGIRMTYKRDQSNGAERASVIAYIWTGTWTQVDVPSNTAVGVFSYGTATKVTMTDRDRNILGMETALGGEVTKTDDAELMASLVSYITEQQDEWTTFEAYFDYKNDQFSEVDDWGDVTVKDTKLNIIISANDYFADRSSIVGNNSLTIDNVELIYNSQLTDLKFNGETIEGFDKDTYSYTIDDYYKAGSIEAIKNCVGGSCETKYNVSTAQMTITVKGDDWSEENLNQHVYTIQFRANGDTYQIKNADFEAWEDVVYDAGYMTTSGEEPLYWNSFLTGTGALKAFAGANQVEHITGTTRPGSEGNACVRIFARDVYGMAIAQGNLTTGCINMGSGTASDAAGNYNYSNSEDPDLCHWFTGLPDAMRVWVKASVEGTAKASAILHTDGYYQDPFYNDDDRITAQLVAEATEANITASEDWQELNIPFVYNEEVTSRPSYALVSFSTSSIPGDGATTDEMYIDDVEFIYNSELATLTFNGTDYVNNFENGVVVIDESYDAAALNMTSNGRGAAIETEYNESSAVLTITVKGDDWSEENQNQHVYTVQFKANGGTSINAAKAAQTFDVYTATGVQVRHNATTLEGLQKGIYVVNGKKYIVK